MYSHETLVALLRKGDVNEIIRRHELAISSSAPLAENAVTVVSAALASRGNVARARELLRQFVEAPGRAMPATYNLAIRLAGDANDTIAAYDLAKACVKTYPEQIEHWQQLVRFAVDCGRERDALAHCVALRIQPWARPDLALCYATLVTRGLSYEAGRRAFEQLLFRWPNDATASPVYRELMINAFPNEARRAFDEVPGGTLNSDWSALSIRAALAVPKFVDSEDDAVYWREQLQRSCGALSVALAKSPLSPWERLQCIEVIPGWLPYADGNVREAQVAWGQILTSAAADTVATAPIEILGTPTARRAIGARRPRVGIVLNRAQNTSAGAYFDSWIEAILSADCDTCFYSVEAERSAMQHYGARATLWRHLELASKVREFASDIRRDECDVLLYPELNPSIALNLLAAMRLAPIQAVGFGVPCTTGLPTIDVFFTADAVDNPAAVSLGHYSERTVLRLPGLGARFLRSEPPVADPPTRSELGLPEDRPLILASQAAVKWTPRFADALIAIARAVPDAEVIVIGEDPLNVDEYAFERWLDQRFRAAGMHVAQHVRRYTWSSRATYLARSRHCAVSLDTLAFGAGATALDAISSGVPIVTLPGEFLRSRQAAAMLRHVGVTDTIAGSVDEYISHVKRFCSDQRSRDDVSRALVASAPRLFDSGSDATAALVEELLALCKRA